MWPGTMKYTMYNFRKMIQNHKTNIIQDSSVGIAVGSGQWAGWPWFDSWEGQEIHLHRVQPSCGAHQASYPVGVGGFFPGAKVAGE
jgi:hypothetical protein